MVNFEQIKSLKSKDLIKIDNEYFKFRVTGFYSLLWDLQLSLLRLFIAIIVIYRIFEIYHGTIFNASTYILITVIITLALIGVKLVLEKRVRHYIYDVGAYKLSKTEI